MTEAPLAYGEKQTITVKTELREAQDGDVVVNKAVGRAENTKMRMRTCRPVHRHRHPRTGAKRRTDADAE
ncbi:hypothetical protein HMPREF3160_01890 [Arthrobacter sp. HMSC06H05]|nr:hypothetical protein HMPREF3160_01890 [Arthrobacter sp. HMSC06H05]